MGLTTNQMGYSELGGLRRPWHDDCLDEGEVLGILVPRVGVWELHVAWGAASYFTAEVGVGFASSHVFDYGDGSFAFGDGRFG